jgi:SAM-dependent methyltransferase
MTDTLRRMTGSADSRSPDPNPYVRSQILGAPASNGPLACEATTRRMQLIPAFDRDPAGCAAALARLSAIGLTEAAVRDRLGLNDLNDLQMRALPIYRAQRLHERDPQACAIDLFLLQGTLPAAELDRVMDPPDQEAMLRAGILERSGDSARALLSLYPVGTSLVFSDHAWSQLDAAGAFAVPYDTVMYVGTDSRWLARATVRGPVASALDLCCGSGIHALLAAAHAGQAVAVDINPRAVACTVFNARALGLSNLQALRGDLYAPVGGRSFDLITANPPFVPAPVQDVGFRDGGASGEDIQRRIVEGLPRHLAKGGTAQIVTELGERDGEPLESRLRQWLGEAPMDIHVLRLRVHPAQVYAIGHAGGDGHAAFLDSVARWSANLSAQGYARVVSVLLAFQWSDPVERPWTRVDEAHAPGRDAGPEVSALFSAERLARDPALRERLEAGRVARTGPVALLDSRALGTQVPRSARANRLGQAMRVEHALDPLERDLLAAMEQPIATADFLAAAAQSDVAAAAVVDALVSLVRKGLARLAP